MQAVITTATPAEMFVASLQRWQAVDALDYEGSWFQAYVVMTSESHIRVHFVGWEVRWCENITIKDAKVRLRARREDSRVGPGGEQTVQDVMKIHRCGGGGGA
jgi:hypothetical protein